MGLSSCRRQAVHLLNSKDMAHGIEANTHTNKVSSTLLRQFKGRIRGELELSRYRFSEVCHMS